MAYRNNNAEGMSPSTTVAASQSGSGDAFDIVSIVNGATLKYSADYAIHGSQSYRFTTTTTGGDLCYVHYSGANDTSGSIRYYFYAAGRPSAAVVIAQLRNATTAVGSVLCSSSFRLQCQDTAGANIGTFANPLVSGVWYRVELTLTVATSTTGSGTFAYYLGDSTTPVESPFVFTTENFGTTNITDARYGKVTGTGALTNFYFDDIAFDNGNSSLIGGYSLTAAAPWLSAL